MSDPNGTRDPSSPEHVPPSLDQDAEDDLRRTRPRLNVPADVVAEAEAQAQAQARAAVPPDADVERESELPTPPHGTPGLLPPEPKVPSYAPGAAPAGTAPLPSLEQLSALIAPVLADVPITHPTTDDEEVYEPLTPIAGMRVISLRPRPSDPPNAPLPPVVVEPPADPPTLRRSQIPPAPGTQGAGDPGWTPMAAPVAETEAALASGEAEAELAEDEIEITESDEPPPTPVHAPPRSLPPTAPRSAPPPPSGPPPPPVSIPGPPKRKPWWEELFDQDYLRTLRRLTDRQLLAEIAFIEERLGLQNGAEILDLGSGTGRHANGLQQRGYRVTGLDISPAMVNVANTSGSGARATFVQGDMLQMTYEAAFDGVICWGTTFGYFEEEKNIALLGSIRKALRPGGVVLLDIANRDYVAAEQPNLVWFEGTGCVCIDETTVDFITSRLRVKRTMKLEDGRAKETDYSLRLYSLHEIGKLLKDAGFRVVEVSGQTATPGVFFGQTSPRCLVLAERD